MSTCPTRNVWYSSVVSVMSDIFPWGSLIHHVSDPLEYVTGTRSTHRLLTSRLRVVGEEVGPKRRKQLRKTIGGLKRTKNKSHVNLFWNSEKEPTGRYGTEVLRQIR